MRVAVVGGGITGVSAAYTLARRAKDARLPLEITVFESDRRLGGKVLTERAPGLILEGGPDSFLVRKPWMRELCLELGLDEELVSLFEGRLPTFMRFRGRLRSIPAGLGMGLPRDWGAVLRSDLLSWRGKLRLAAERYVPARPGDADESLAEFARRRLGREAANRVMEPMLAGIYGGEADRLSLLSTFPGLRAMEQRDGSLWAAGRRQRAKRTGGGEQPSFQSLASGLESSIERMRKEAQGVRFLTGQEVIEGAHQRDGNEEENGKVNGEGIGDSPYVLRCADGSTHRFDRVILATPATAAARILAEIAPKAAAGLRAIPYASATSVYLVYRKAEVSHPLHGTGYLSVAETRDNPVRGTTWASSKWPHTSDEETVVIRCHMGKIGGRAPIECDDEQLVREARGEMRRVLQIGAQPVLTRVFHWQEAFPQYLVGHLERIRVIEEALPPGMWVTGAAFRGVGLPDCVRQGREAAERVLQSLEPK